MLMNRIADVLLLLALLLLLLIFKTSDYLLIFNLMDLLAFRTLTLFSYTLPVTDVIALLLLGGALGKSAQLGLHT